MTQRVASPPVPLVLFCGPDGQGTAEALVDGARRAAALDLLALAASTGVFSPLLLVTPDPDHLASLPAGVRVVLTRGSPGFHVGRALYELVCAEGFPRVLSAGAGAGVLLRAGDLLALALPLQGERPAVVANNLYSSDLVGVVPALALGRIELPAEDNALAFLLWRRAGLPGHEPPRTAATQFDLDSPTDLGIAALHAATGPRLRSYLGGLGLGPSTGLGQALVRLRAAARVFRDPLGQAIVAGRVGSATWAYLERQTACRVRLFAEERGMRALGLEGQARSLLGLHLEAVGPVAFMEHLAELGQAAFVDTRVLLAHRRSAASREDRFLSDLGRWEEVRDPFLRDLTAAAVAAPIPIVLGGQNLVSGGLMALVEAAWTETEGDVHDHPRG
ncbi:MAG: hypothetical protein HY688_02640 [Chloroflexi bacterium]|nr:hypothetical protein [Chloroflexota bacterium]